MANVRNLEIAGTTDIDVINFGAADVSKVVYNGETVWENVPDTPYIEFTYQDGSTYTLAGTENLLQFFVNNRDATPNYSRVTQIKFLPSLQGFTVSSSQFSNGVEICDAYNALVHVEGMENLTGITRVSNFFQACDSYNEPLIFPPNVTYYGSILNIGIAFNQEVTLPENVRIDGCFYALENFNQPVHVPATVDFTHATFRLFTRLNKFTGPLELNTTMLPQYSEPYATFNNPYQALGLYGTSAAPTSPAYVTGLTLTGSAASLWKQTYPNLDAFTPEGLSGVYYRKLLLGN